MRQNYGHVKALEDLLSVNDVHSIVAFVNGTIKTELPENVVRLENVNDYIQSFEKKVYHLQKVNQLITTLNESSISDRQARKSHVKNVKTVKNSR